MNNYCSNCGKQLTEEDKVFCSNCGNNIEIQNPIQNTNENVIMTTNNTISKIKIPTILAIVIIIIFVIVFSSMVQNWYDNYSENIPEAEENYNTNNNKSNKMVETIDFSQMSNQEISDWCSENKITCDITQEYSETIEKGKFIKQSVAPNEKIIEGSSISIVYSMGRKPTISEKNALKQAQQYSETLHGSKTNIHDYLIRNGFTEEETQYALDNLNVDYKKNALEKAKSYQEYAYLSKPRIREHLIDNGFSNEEVQYAMDNLED